MWTASRILKEIAGPDRRRTVLTSFWRRSEPTLRATVQIQLARALKFREETIRKMPPEKKAELLASRIGIPEFEEYLENALMLHHTGDKTAMMAAFLDRWSVPHQNGSIDADDYSPPDAAQVREAVNALETEYAREDVLLYLATAGLLMGGKWEEATWPVVNEMTS